MHEEVVDLIRKSVDTLFLLVADRATYEHLKARGIPITLQLLNIQRRTRGKIQEATMKDQPPHLLKPGQGKEIGGSMNHHAYHREEPWQNRKWRQSMTQASYPQGAQKKPMPAGSQRKRDWKAHKSQTSFPQGAKFPKGAPMLVPNRMESGTNRSLKILFHRESHSDKVHLCLLVPNGKESGMSRSLKPLLHKQNQNWFGFRESMKSWHLYREGPHKEHPCSQRPFRKNLWPLGPHKEHPCSQRPLRMNPWPLGPHKEHPCSQRPLRKNQWLLGPHKEHLCPCLPQRKHKCRLGPIRENQCFSGPHKWPASFQQKQISKFSQKRPCPWNMEDSDNAGLFQPPSFKKRHVELEPRAFPNTQPTLKRPCPWSTVALGTPKHTYFQHGAPHAALSLEVGPKPAMFPQGAVVPTSLPQATTLPASFPQRPPTPAYLAQQQSSQCSWKRPCPWSTEDLDNGVFQTPPLKKQHIWSPEPLRIHSLLERGHIHGAQKHRTMAMLINHFHAKSGASSQMKNRSSPTLSSTF
ncbi:hypothetical protein QQF64_026910 [Cirrhinus molitorella]|uniref:Uncharacterized protein n=1 Tax=Cirrhinus molitorella TaxID=172907 RepID=A0ABR3NB85_9TELE